MEHENNDKRDTANQSTQKVCIRETEGDPNVVMDSTSITEKPFLWKDCLLGLGGFCEGLVPRALDCVWAVPNGATLGHGFQHNTTLSSMVIEETIGKVAKLDFNTDNGVRGRFAGMAVHYGHVKEFFPNGMNRQKETEKGDANGKGE
ncbi:hypothetical protein GOBAR_AA10726 [Gossypium barbadense]|uniref:Uncharacterized protein n=1 Tax=Gossypium barbadense TaxID=3634 RepID=A0A2P5Y2X0_GOSBA|nr:hypothetical protein GOBAR_AA10726 [Gossypium barbadense]